VQAVVNAHVAATDYEQQQSAEDEPLGLDPVSETEPGAEPFGRVVEQQPASPPDIERQIEAGMKLMRDNPNEYYSEKHQAHMAKLFEAQQLQAEQGEALAPTTTNTTATIGDNADE
jgi:hypothetical protein